ncbi:EamA family transporter [Corynebacterium sp. J010B-136]|uniref:EamA family transporter n=1 Tax=Corynebacterium sp. J010B-136 TaxID=2099401 RepID=UPI001E40F1E5|nr:EamA family transporter [Corynebacterium sp. J010B-136]
MRKAGKSSALGLLKSPCGIKIALALNLFTAGAFCLFYVSATLIPPTAASVIETGIGPLVVAVFVAFAAQRFSKSLIPPLVIVVLALGYFFLGDVDASSGTVVGFLLAIAAGMSAVGVLYSSQWASQLGLDVISIAAIRFHLAWILSGVVAFSTIDMTSFSQGEITSTVALSVLCITFPILLLQWGIILAPPFVAALIIAALPAVVMITEILLGASINPIQLVILSLIVLITIGQAIKR